MVCHGFLFARLHATRDDLQYFLMSCLPEYFNLLSTVSQSCLSCGNILNRSSRRWSWANKQLLRLNHESKAGYNTRSLSERRDRLNETGLTNTEANRCWFNLKIFHEDGGYEVILIASKASQTLIVVNTARQLAHSGTVIYLPSWCWYQDGNSEACRGINGIIDQPNIKVYLWNTQYDVNHFS